MNNNQKQTEYININLLELDKLEHPANILINKNNVREIKKEIIEILNKINTERERLNDIAFKKTKDAKEQLNLIWKIAGLDEAYKIVSDYLNFDEHIEALKF